MVADASGHVTMLQRAGHKMMSRTGWSTPGKHSLNIIRQYLKTATMSFTTHTLAVEEIFFSFISNLNGYDLRIA